MQVAPAGRFLANLLPIVLVLSLSFATLGNISAKASTPDPDTFVMNFDRPLDSMNIYSQGGYVMWDLTNYVFDFLMEHDPKTGELRPMLAESYELKDNGKVAIFKIRKGVTFHDGKPLTAEDVKFSWDAHNDLRFKSIRFSPARNETTATVIDPHTIQFTFAKPGFQKFESVARWMNIMPKHFYGDLKNKSLWNKKLLGSGPYSLEKFKRAKRVNLKRNAKWWGFKAKEYSNRHQFPKMQVRYISDPLLMVKALEKGELDLIRFFEPVEYEKIASGPLWGKTIERVKTDKGRIAGSRAISLNLRNPIFADKRTRQALLHLFNRELVNEKLYFGAMKPGVGPWNQNGLYADPSVKPIKYDPKKALELLRAVGWKDSDKDGILDMTVDGKKVNFSFTILNYKKDREKMLTMFREAVRAMGIDAKVKTLEAQTCFKLVHDLKFDAYYWQGAWSSVNPHVYNQYHSKYADMEKAPNTMGYKNKEMDKLLEKVLVAFDQKERQKLMRQVYRILAEDVPELPLFDDNYTMYGVSKRVKRPFDTLPYAFGKHFWSMKSESSKSVNNISLKTE